MSRRETLYLAHTAECKLKLAANRPDRNLRFLLGHALTLDSVNLRLIQIEEENQVIRQPKHSSSVQFRSSDSGGIRRSPLSGRQKTPPPSAANAGLVIDDEEDNAEDDEDEDTDSESDHDDLSLQRFPSAAAQSRHPTTKQPRTPSDRHDEDSPSDSSSDDDDMESLLLMLQKHLNHESLEKITKTSGDESIASLYRSVQKCTCHQKDVPEFRNLWPLPTDQEITAMKGFDKIRFAIAEVGA